MEVPAHAPQSQVIEYRKPAGHRRPTGGERLFGGFLVVAAALFGLFALAPLVAIWNRENFRWSEAAVMLGAAAVIGAMAWFCGRLATEFFAPAADGPDEET